MKRINETVREQKISRQAIDKWIRKLGIEKHKTGKTFMISEEDYDRIIEARSKTATKAQPKKSKKKAPSIYEVYHEMVLSTSPNVDNKKPVLLWLSEAEIDHLRRKPWGQNVTWPIDVLSGIRKLP